MKEIKIRAWDVLNKAWIDLFAILFSQDGDILSVKSLDGECYGLHQIELIQYTGLKDKAGTEIYEGDIVSCLGLTRGQYEDMLGYVLCEYGCYKAVRVGGEFDGKARMLAGHRDILVIGNIHENPELMEDK